MVNSSADTAKPSKAETVRHGVSYTLEGAVAVIEVRRPTSKNALDVSLRYGLLAAARRARSDRGRARAVLLRAEGDTFCVGQDLKEHAQALLTRPATAFSVVHEEYNPLVEALSDLPQPVVVAIEGACVGAGLGLALCGDFLVAGRTARFAAAFAGIGLAADSGLSRALVRTVGASRARALLMLGDRIEAEEARQWGLVHQVVPEGHANFEGMALAQRLAAGPSAAYAEIKELLRDSSGAELRVALEREAAAQQRLGTTVDHRAAVDSFLAREKPAFKGH